MQKIPLIPLLTKYNIQSQTQLNQINLIIQILIIPNRRENQKMTKRQRPQSLSKQLAQQSNHSAQNTKGMKNQSEKKQQSLNKKQENTNSLSKLLTAKISDFSMYKSDKEKDLPQQFFRQEVVDLAKALLGKVFVRKTQKGIIKAVIVETQAYKAPLDKGCHAYNNKKTQRTKYFWLDGGHLYIYTIYMPTNICLNVVAGQKDQPQAVLIRAVQPVQGLNLVKQYRKIKSPKIQDLSNGPGKVGQALAINMQTMNGMSLFDPDGQFKVIDAGISGFGVGVSRRINIDYAQEWIDKPWRFYVEGNKFVSKVDLQAPPKVKPSKSKNKGK